MNDHRYSGRSYNRSPPPFRHKRSSSPSPYRRSRDTERSPSPFRNARNDRGRDSIPNVHKRKASAPRHDRPEKRTNAERGHRLPRRPQLDDARTGARQYNLHRNHENDIDRNINVTNGRHNLASSSDSMVQQGLQDGHENGNVHPRHRDADIEMTMDVEEKVPTQESREEKKRRWAAKRVQHATENSKLLQQALLANTSEVNTPDVGSPATPIEMSVSPPFGSPRLPDIDSVPASPDVMLVGKQETESARASPAVDGPSASDYDPTQDMLDDRLRAENRAHITEISASSYDETNPNMLSTLPAEKIQPIKKKKKELDMFAFSDDENEGGDEGVDDEEEIHESAKGTVLDAKLLDNWDDSEGYYKLISNELVNAGRYRMIKYLGRGVFANVAQAEDVADNSGRLVAIKIIRRNDAMKKASQREMELLQRLNDTDPQDKRHIIRLFGAFDHKGHLCIVFEHMAKNLRDLLKEETSGHGLSFTALKAYTRQMMSGLKHLQDCQIVHADLKPDNILVSLDKKIVKLCDLGTATDKRDNQEPTPYLVSRFYRAPEIVLGMDISYGIDMWAIGCTIYELWTGKILFPGRSNNQMVKVIMECLGWPSEKFLRKGQLSGDHYDAGPPLKFLSREVDQYGKDVLRVIEQHRMTIRSLKSRIQDAARGITDQGPSTSELNEFADLLSATLNWNPEKRIQAKEALSHKFFVKPALAPRAAVVKPAFPRRANFGPRK